MAATGCLWSAVEFRLEAPIYPNIGTSLWTPLPPWGADCVRRSGAFCVLESNLPDSRWSWWRVGCFIKHKSRTQLICAEFYLHVVQAIQGDTLEVLSLIRSYYAWCSSVLHSSAIYVGKVAENSLLQRQATVSHSCTQAEARFWRGPIGRCLRTSISIVSIDAFRIKIKWKISM